MNIVFGRRAVPEGKLILNNMTYFELTKQPEWFEDSFVKGFIRDIDGATVVLQEALISKAGHGISTLELSTGCKSLCLLTFDEDGLYYNGTLMGNNCVPFLLEIARKKDINIFLEHFMGIPNEAVTSGIISINGVVKTGEYDYEDAYDDYAIWMSEETEKLWRSYGI